MPLALSAFPLSTPLDPIEDPPSSIDPLGTAAHAERLVDLVLPGLTARMWPIRLLTLATLTAEITDRVVRRLAGKEEAHLEARLTFERLVVSAIIRWAQKNPQDSQFAHRRLPGSELARTALESGEPLSRQNFLKGQA